MCLNTADTEQHPNKFVMKSVSPSGQEHLMQLYSRILGLKKQDSKDRNYYTS